MLTGSELIVLVICGFIARWLWHALFHPFAPCRRCKGAKVNPGSTGKRFGLCWRCGGSGSRQVTGSAQVHKVLRIRRGLAGRKGK